MIQARLLNKNNVKLRFFVFVGAPAIAITGVLVVAFQITKRNDFQSIEEIKKYAIER